MVDASPFPTLYWLTCRRASAAVSRLESSGLMRVMNDRLAGDREFAASVDGAHHDYVARRDAHAVLLGAGGIGGGPADRIKCLHAHYAHHAAGGPNPVGEWVEQQTGPLLHGPPCIG